MAIPTASPSATSSPVPDPAGASPVIARHGPAAAAEVEAEVQILRDAHAALQAGDPAGALALLDVHARRFPAGALAEEREATRPAALCVLGRTADARQAAAQFLRSFPDSLHAARVRKVCDTKQRETF
jgi:hypothetical protein